MFPKYFQDELRNLRDLGADFSKRHPALAPMLNGPQADPDVERLLEGTAFLTALLRQKIDDEFPEIVHDVLETVAPHYLRPVPSATIQVFHPKATVRDTVQVPAGTLCKSIPVEGTSCPFQTRYATELHPLALVEAGFAQPPGGTPAIKLTFELQGLPLSQWKPERLRLYLADDYARAADLYYLLRRHLRGIRLVPAAGGTAQRLGRRSLHPVGFHPSEGLAPYPSQAHPGAGVVQEYFVLPQKFLFLDIVGWDTWTGRGAGSRFEVHFELDELPFGPPVITKNSFLLHAAPAVNLFAHEADPVFVDHHRPEYHVRPFGPNAEHYEIFSFGSVRGLVQGTAEERTYAPFDVFRRVSAAQPVYHQGRKPSATHAGVEHSLAIVYPGEGAPPAPETLSVELQCTNGSLPGNLRAGDISLHGKNTPEFVTFENLLAPTPGIAPPVGRDVLWRLVSHLSVSFQSLEKVETLKALLELYIFPDSSAYSAAANRKRIAGIRRVSAKGCDRLVDGYPVRGREITLEMQEDHFSSRGDLFLFGCVLDAFFGNFASINSFTQLMMRTSGGSEMRWPERLGLRPLI